MVGAVIRPGDIGAARYPMWILVVCHDSFLSAFESPNISKPNAGFTTASAFRSSNMRSQSEYSESIFQTFREFRTACKLRSFQKYMNVTKKVIPRIKETHHQTVLTGPNLFAPKKQKLEQNRWRDLAPDLLRSIFGSSILHPCDVFGTIVLVCKSWRRSVVDHRDFLKNQKRYWQQRLEYRVPQSDHSQNLQTLKDKIASEFPWFDSQFKSSIVQVIKEQFPQHKTLTDTGCFLTFLLLGGSELRRFTVQILLPQSFNCSRARQPVLELLYFLVNELHCNNESWNNVCEDLRHLIHLYESLKGFPLPEMFVASTSSKQVLTPEQQGIVQARFSKGQLIKIHALAGTGKTTTLLHYAKARPGEKMLYLAFNVSVRQEASRIFPQNVTCMNLHALAFSRVGWKFQKTPGKFASEFSLPQIQNVFADTKSEVFCSYESVVLGVQKDRFFAMIRSTLLSYLQSNDATIGYQHTNAAISEQLQMLHVDNSILKTRKAAEEDLASLLVVNAIHLWKRTRDSSDISFPITHDGYLKLFQLSKFDLSNKYDTILLDEAQDCSPCACDIVMQQSNCVKILVGDEHQAIYGFAGGKNALTVSRPGERSFHLSRCFRFGVDIANVSYTVLYVKRGHTEEIILKLANGIIGTLKAPLQRLLIGTVDQLENCKGIRKMYSQLYQMRDFVENGPGIQKNVACISRTSLALLEEVLALLTDTKIPNFGIVGGAEGAGFQLLVDICHLENSRPDLIKDSFVKRFASVELMEKEVTLLKNDEWKGRMQIFKRYKNADSLPELLSLCSVILKTEKSWQNASYVFSTVHKAKGLEFHTVLLSSDFCDLTDRDNLMVEEINVIYVAITRAKKQLYVNKSLQDLLSATNLLLSPKLVPKSNSNPSCSKCGSGIPVFQNLFQICHELPGFEDVDDIYLCEECRPLSPLYHHRD